jgi:hypothetical protein
MYFLIKNSFNFTNICIVAQQKRCKARLDHDDVIQFDIVASVYTKYNNNNKEK